jgi:hypothetical protein
VLALEKPESADWATVAFDHITVSARSGSRLGVTCLTPRSEGKRAVVVSDASPADPDPCADLHGGAYAGVDGVYPPQTIYDDWDFTTSPWTINFSAVRPGDAVSLEAKAVFGGAAAEGGRVGVMTAHAQVRADSSFPGVSLAFAAPPARAFWGQAPEHCEQGEDLASWTSPSTFKNQPANAKACPRLESTLAYTSALTRIATPMGVVGRIPPVLVSGCPGGEPEGIIAWRSDPVAIEGPCTTLTVTGRFATCTSGDPRDPAGCPTTIRCTPPPTDLLVLSGERVVRSRPISCVPSYPEPVQYLLPYREGEPGPVTVAIRRGPSEGGCFFDIYDFDVQAGCRQ